LHPLFESFSGLIGLSIPSFAGTFGRSEAILFLDRMLASLLLPQNLTRDSLYVREIILPLIHLLMQYTSKLAFEFLFLYAKNCILFFFASLNLCLYFLFQFLPITHVLLYHDDLHRPQHGLLEKTSVPVGIVAKEYCHS